MNRTLEIIILSIGMILFLGWLYVMFLLIWSGVSTNSNCTTPSGDSYYCDN